MHLFLLVLWGAAYFGAVIFASTTKTSQHFAIRIIFAFGPYAIAGAFAATNHVKYGHAWSDFLASVSFFCLLTAVLVWTTRRELRG